MSWSFRVCQDCCEVSNMWGCGRQFTSPVDVRWEAMDAQLLRRFWERHAAERASAADISDRVLVFHRGISDVRPSRSLLVHLLYQPS